MFAGLQIAAYMVFTASSAAPQPISFDQILDDFDSTEGLFLRAADLRATGPSEYPVSSTVWRNDLPLALFAPPGRLGSVPSDAVGFILNRGEIQTQCAYPVNALSAARKSVDGERDGCGAMPGFNNSGSCGQDISAESFVAAYMNKPQQRNPIQLPWRHQTIWMLELAVCHFEDVSVMLEAQKMLLNRSAVAPTGVTPEEWLGNATHAGTGLTTYNEVIIGPVDESVFGSIFWAHAGPFREPLPSDRGACEIAAVLGSNLTTLPIIELAGVNLEYPFEGCGTSHGRFSRPSPSPTCLSQGVAEWNANLTVGGGKRDASSVFREVDGATFLDLDCSGVQVV